MRLEIVDQVNNEGEPDMFSKEGLNISQGWARFGMGRVNSSKY